MKNKFLKNTVDLLRINFNTIVEFEIIYKLFTGLLFFPLTNFGIKLAMDLTNNSYITTENIVQFIINPITIVILLLLLVFLTFITMFDISTLIIIYDLSYQDKKIKMFDAVKISFKKCLKLLSYKNILVSFVVLFLIPFLGLGIGASVITSINIPTFIMDYINKNTLLNLSMIIIFILLTFILMRWIYSLYYMVLEDKTFNQARRKSEDLIRDNIIKDILKILLIQLIISIVYMITLISGIVLITWLYKTLSNYLLVESILITLIWVFIAILLLLFTILSNPISYALLSNLFYRHKIQKNEEIILINYNKEIKNLKLNKYLKKSLTVVIVVGLMLGSIVTYQIVNGETNLNIEYAKKIEITAHRGASYYYPENTMAAFVGAKEMGADWIELDVHQTKDQKAVVCHDANLKRVTGINKNVYDVTYDEILSYDAGSSFNDSFKGEKIPLLEDVIKYAKENNIKLNIEIKPTGKEIEIERQVINLINKYEFRDNCYIASLNYNVITKTKEIDPNIRTLYLMALAIGDVTKLDKADSFSIEASNINDALVDKIHNAGKELHVWTVNDESTMQSMINYSVDNIITDDIRLAKELIAENKSSNFINELVRLLN